MLANMPNVKLNFLKTRLIVRELVNMLQAVLTLHMLVPSELGVTVEHNCDSLNPGLCIKLHAIQISV